MAAHSGPGDGICCVMSLGELGGTPCFYSVVALGELHSSCLEFKTIPEGVI